MLASSEESSSGAFVCVLFYFCLYSVLGYWNLSIGKAVPCHFLCLNFLLELFLYTLCDYIGKKTGSRHFSNCVAKNLHLIPYVSTCYIFLSSKNWHLLTHFTGTGGQAHCAGKIPCYSPGKMLLWGYKEHNCWFLMLVCSFMIWLCILLKNNFTSMMIKILGFYYSCINSCL